MKNCKRHVVRNVVIEKYCKVLKSKSEEYEVQET